MPFRNVPHIFCLLLCTNALASYMVSHPVRSLFVVTLAHSLLLQIAYIGSVFFLVCLAALAEISKGLSISIFFAARNPDIGNEKQGLADCRHRSRPAWAKVDGERYGKEHRGRRSALPQRASRRITMNAINQTSWP
ncbi:exopolysaccharide production repressor protein [Ensifer sp. LCM 4579]|uniref:exopolysaccharide production repressor protein n=1 Tax=Ensifer sp. LCM 4579 TaxID=1848292 RepID=UPI0008DA4E5F